MGAHGNAAFVIQTLLLLHKQFIRSIENNEERNGNGEEETKKMVEDFSQFRFIPLLLNSLASSQNNNSFKTEEKWASVRTVLITILRLLFQLLPAHHVKEGVIEHLVQQKRWNKKEEEEGEMEKMIKPLIEWVVPWHKKYGLENQFVEW